MTGPNVTIGSPTAGGAPGVRALDPEVLGRLAELDPTGANGLVRRVLIAFASSLDRLREQLLVGSEDGDQAVVRYVAHTLKSSAGSVGATRLAQVCAETERRVREGEFASPQARGRLDESVRLLLDEIEGVRAAVEQRLTS